LQEAAYLGASYSKLPEYSLDQTDTFKAIENYKLL
jgi:hypothetical protein